MIYYCAVRDCSMKSSDRAAGIRFFSFPQRQADLDPAWIEVVGRSSDWSPTKYSKICSRHFLAEDINGMKLRKNVVPKPLHLMPENFEIFVGKADENSKGENEDLIVNQNSYSDELDPLEFVTVEQSDSDSDDGELMENGEVMEEEDSCHCDQCTFVADSIANLEKHRNSIHDSPSSFSCDEYEFTTNQAGYLKAHKIAVPEETLVGNGIFVPAYLLKQILENTSALWNDVNRNRLGIVDMSENVQQCPYCDYTSSKASNLRIHIESKHEGVRYPCDQCDYVATLASSLRRHEESVHLGLRYYCDLCEFSATQKPVVKKHKEIKHGTGKSHIKVEIDVNANDQNSSVSKEANISISKRILMKKQFPCKQCEYTAATKSNLKLHMESKHGGKRYPCSQCNYVATLSSSLKRHKESVHQGIRYPCDMCNFTATQKPVLKTHKLLRHADNSAVTHLFTSSTQQLKKQSVKEGSWNERRKKKRRSEEHPCNKCSYVSTTASSLRFHTEAKHDHVRYPCKQCDYVATLNSSLKRHILSVHEGLRFHCDECDFSSTRKFIVMSHKRSKH